MVCWPENQGAASAEDRGVNREACTVGNSGWRFGWRGVALGG